MRDADIGRKGRGRQADNFVDLADLADMIGRPARLPKFISENRGHHVERDDAED